MRPKSGCSTKISAALENNANANTGAAIRRATASMFSPAMCRAFCHLREVKGMDFRRAASTLGSMETSPNYESAERLLREMKSRGLTIATAESCTGGLIAATLAAVPGASASLERGFVTYSNAAKTELLGVPAELIREHGAVSREVALAMVAGALSHSPADVAVAVTGIAGPDGGTAAKPVGLVHISAARRGGVTLHEEMRFGAIGRHEVQLATVAAAFALMVRTL